MQSDKRSKKLGETKVVNAVLQLLAEVIRECGEDSYTLRRAGYALISWAEYGYPESEEALDKRAGMIRARMQRNANSAWEYANPESLTPSTFKALKQAAAAENELGNIYNAQYDIRDLLTHTRTKK